MKTICCSTCGETLSLDKFEFRKKNGYYRKQCKECHKVKSRARHKERAEAEITDRKCETCGKLLNVFQEIFCSVSCINKGRESSEETKKKLSEALKGNTYRIGRKCSEKTKRKLSKATKGRKKSLEWRRKMRIIHINKIQANYGIVFPNYNKRACEYFKKFDEDHNTLGQYALYGGGEYHIKYLGYWLDYINHDLKLIIEWDEKRHYNSNGDLKERDVIKQKEVEGYFLDYTFTRIKETELID